MPMAQRGCPHPPLPAPAGICAAASSQDVGDASWEGEDLEAGAQCAEAVVRAPTPRVMVKTAHRSRPGRRRTLET